MKRHSRPNLTSVTGASSGIAEIAIRVAQHRHHHRGAGGHELLMLAIMAGLVIGKPLGLVAVSALAVQLGFAVERDEYCLRQLAGAGALAGIAFTMSLFIAVARRPRRPPISPPRGSPCLPPRCCPPSSTWPCRRIGAPAGDPGIVPGSAERAEERHLGFI